MKPIDHEQAFQFPAIPTEIVFGFGVIERLPEKIREAHGTRVFLVTDRGVVAAGLADRVSAVLAKAGVDVCVFDEIPQDSSSAVVEAAAARLTEERCDIVVGLGGGSSLDASKAVAVCATNEPPIVRYAGLNNVKNRPLPCIAIPTTAGTGSEVTYWSVMTDDATHVKTAIGGGLVFPRLALCDPELTLGLPPMLTASTGMDALTHAIESYVNTSYQPISSALTYRAIELIGGALERAVADGGDREARYMMLLGSTLAALGMNPTRLGIVHALAMPLGSWDLKIPHGVGNAVLLPHAMEFNVSANPGAYADVARALNEHCDGLDAAAAARKAVSQVRAIADTIGIPQGLGALGLTREMIPQVCAEAIKSGNIPVNPRHVTEHDLREICAAAL
ncbi:MAG: iron-containing alcohol dehydrogenase [Spirochaetaceae bacterium]|nr:MAG: iron-containing alcohol dehydrogenase [Spirochaetaceae bacterium]